MRRNVFATGLLVLVCGFAAAGTNETVLVVGGHPDDLVGSAGLCLLMRDRFDVHLADFTRGDRGQKRGADLAPLARRRTTEELAACKLAGVTPHFIDEINGLAFASQEACERMAKLIGELKPRAIIMHWPIDIHMDHMMSAATLQKAARMTGFKGEYYFFEESYDSKGFPDVFYVDITSVAKEKERLIRLYVCQNTNDGMCVEEMQNSSRRALRMWPFRMGGYAEAFAPYVGRPQGSCIFAELPRDPEGAKMPTWGR